MYFMLIHTILLLIIWMINLKFARKLRFFLLLFILFFFNGQKVTFIKFLLQIFINKKTEKRIKMSYEKFNVWYKDTDFDFQFLKNCLDKAWKKK